MRCIASVSYTHLDVYKRQLQRMTEDRLPKAAVNYKAVGRRDVGRPRMRWELEQVYKILILEEEEKALI